MLFIQVLFGIVVAGMIGIAYEYVRSISLNKMLDELDKETNM